MSVSPPTPSMRAPAGLPPSGNTKYVIIAIVLVLGTGALVLRQCSSSQPTANNSPRPASTFDAAPISHDIDTLPPPPEPEEAVPEAGVQRQQTAYDPCLAKTCSGSTSTELEQSIAFRAKTAHRCYDQALANDSDLKGHVQLKVKVGSNGTLCAANVSGNDTGMDGVANCVANTFRAARSFPPPKGGCVEIQVPINFVPGGK